MKNYIDLNGTKISLTPEQVEEMKKSFGLNQMKLSLVSIGEIFKIGKYEFVVLEHSTETTAVIMKDLLYDNKKFGKNNNYNNSYIDDICNDLDVDISNLIGKENIIEHTVDLTSDDGLKDYGKIKRRVSLLTANLYRRYVYTLDKYKIDKWWWLSTAYSTPTHENSSWVKCVTPCGNFGSNGCNYDYGVRPFCIFNSNIFVSK